MNFNQMFDKIIRRKISEGESEFPFDQSNWEKANRMINAERGETGMTKSSKLFLVFGSLFLVIATVTIFSLINSKDINNNTVLSDNKITINKNNSNLNNTENNANQLTAKPESPRDKNTEGSQPNNNFNVPAPVSNINSGSQNAQAEINNSIGSDSKIANSKNNTSPKGINSEEVTTVPTVSNDPENKFDKADVLLTDNKSTTKNRNDLKEETTATKENNFTSSGEQNKIKANKPNKGNITASIIEPLGSNLKKKSGTNNIKNYNNAGNKSVDGGDKPVAEPNPEILGSAPIANNEKESADNYLEMRSSILQIWKNEAVLLKSPYDFIRLDEDYYKRNRRKLHFMNLEAGTTYLFGWETNNGKDAKGFNAFGGLNYGMYLSKKLSASLGLQLYNVSNIKQAFYSKSNMDYDFGSNGNYTNITTNSLYYFSIPLRAYYNISRKGKIGLGLNTGFLFNGKNSIQTFTEADNVKSNVMVTKTTGYYEGLSKTNFLVSAFYNHSLTRRIKLNGEVIYGLSDTYNNTSKNGINEKNIGLRLSLQYTLFDK